MRTIKFRAWDTTAKAMILDYKIGFLEGTYSYSINDEFTNEEYVFMQYTGLKDQNGKEIYEGDILVPTNKEMRSIVKFGEATVGDDFHEQTFVGWYLENKNGAVDELNDFEVNSEYRKMEVIGNIHENPELLQK